MPMDPGAMAHCSPFMEVATRRRWRRRRGGTLTLPVTTPSTGDFRGGGGQRRPDLREAQPGGAQLSRASDFREIRGSGRAGSDRAFIIRIRVGEALNLCSPHPRLRSFAAPLSPESSATFPRIYETKTTLSRPPARRFDRYRFPYYYRYRNYYLFLYLSLHYLACTVPLN